VKFSQKLSKKWNLWQPVIWHYFCYLETGKTRERKVSLVTRGQPSCKINNIFNRIKYYLLKMCSHLFGWYFYGIKWPRKTLSDTYPMSEKLSKATWTAFAIQSLHIWIWIRHCLWSFTSNVRSVPVRAWASVLERINREHYSNLCNQAKNLFVLLSIWVIMIIHYLTFTVFPNETTWWQQDKCNKYASMALSSSLSIFVA